MSVGKEGRNRPSEPIAFALLVASKRILHLLGGGSVILDELVKSFRLIALVEGLESRICGLGHPFAKLCAECFDLRRVIATPDEIPHQDVPPRRLQLHQAGTELVLVL